MKKIVSLAVTATLALSCMAPFMAACDDSGISDIEHTIVFYSSQGDSLSKQTEIAIANFQAKYPGWKVSHQTQGGYDDVKEKVVADLQGNMQPDVAYCYADHVAQYLPTEQVLDLNAFINSTATVKGVDPSTKEEKEYVVGYSAEEIADFIPGYYEEGLATNFSGYAECGYTSTSMLTLPFVKSTELLYYNKTVLDELNLEVPETWDELWNVCAPKIADAYPKATVLGYDSEANWFITMCEQNGWGYTSAQGNHYLFNENNEELKAWLEELSGYYDKGWLTTQMDYGSYTSALFIKGVDAGGCVFCIGSSGGASNQKPTGDNFEAGIAPIPGSVVGKDGNGNDIINRSVISQGPSLVMFNAGHGVSNADEKAQMAFLFIKELLDPIFQANFSDVAGYNPSRSSVYELDGYKAAIEKGGMTAMASTVAKDLTDDFFTSPAFVGSSTARTQVGNVLYYVMRSSKTAEKALNDAFKNCGG